MTSVLLNAIYNGGDKFGHVAAYVILGLMLIVWTWIMVKYLDTSDLND